MYDAAYPYDTLEAQDQTFVIACGNNKLFEAVLKVIGRPDLFDDPRFHYLFE